MQQLSIRFPAKPLAVSDIGGFGSNVALAAEGALLLVSVLCIVQAVVSAATQLPWSGRGGLLLLAAVGIGLSAYFGFVRLPQTLRRRRNVRDILHTLNQPEAQPWQLVAIPFYFSHHTRGGQTFYAYTAEIGGQTQEIEFSDNSFEPVRYHGRCLAIAPRHGGTPVPIDTTLRTIRGLTRAERRELIRQIEALVEVQIL